MIGRLLDIPYERALAAGAGMRRPWLLLVAVWFLFIFPSILLLGGRLEEGTLVGIARGVFEDGHWLQPYRYGVRFIERPALISWMLGGIGYVTGYIPLWLARLPTVVALLSGALLIYYLVRAYASTAAALFGALCYMASPLILPKAVVAEPDLVLSTLMFAAVVVLWDGRRQGHIALWRWLAVAVILSFASLVKGPQPLGFFFLGFGAFFLLRMQWTDLIKLALAGLVPAAVTAGWYYGIYQPGDEAAWVRHSRLATPSFLSWLGGTAIFVLDAMAQFLPGWILLLPALAFVVRRPKSERDDLVAALVLYAGVCFVVVALWPGGRGRYAMPAILAVAAAAGLLFDTVRVQSPRLARFACLLLAAFMSYQLVFNWLAVPALPGLLAKSRTYGEFIAEAIKTRPGPLYVATPYINHDFLIYVPGRAKEVPLEFVATAPGPIWAYVEPQQEDELRRLRGDDKVVLHVTAAWPRPWRLVEIR